MWSSQQRRWKIRFDSGLHPDITIAVRMDTCNKSIHDYYILPALEFSHDQIKLSEKNTGFLDSFRTDTLDCLLRLSFNIPLDKVVDNGARNNNAYFRWRHLHIEPTGSEPSNSRVNTEKYL